MTQDATMEVYVSNVLSTDISKALCKDCMIQ